ncbi:RluA family pseudouridine synthase [Pelobacter propionicus]|uniref:Pseudouridine synthase, RluA family n=1 Tax=Pelobacter propionicus (strain DSM 2379 / NBRC 103807 / OttBd1) TaxID=338966 RepID=A1ALH6_PELPD|nr:RluA family pseudouridine synthase [Pelobacter propionicus]ABK98196.1 pseudouridine synthase, RluA family [Pelobacter propionicus DSM 2379]
MIIKKTINDEVSGRRLDEALSLLCDQVSKSEARRIIDRGGCNLNGSMVRVASRMVRSGDTIDVGVMEPGRFRDLVLPQEALLHEDDDLIALNKPAGVNTQRTPYQLKGTLEYWASEYFRRQGNPEPARVIHRLDRGTSGVMLFPKHKRAAAWLSKRFHDGQVEKRYLALVSGTPGQIEWRVDGPIGKIASARYGIVAGGRSALTEFRLLAESCGYALVEAKPLTGRTHQIRVHLQSCGLPIVGDGTYGGEPAARMMLHCASLRFADGGGREIVVEAPLDRDFRGLMEERGVAMTAPGLLNGTVPVP